MSNSEQWKPFCLANVLDGLIVRWSFYYYNKEIWTSGYWTDLMLVLGVNAPLDIKIAYYMANEQLIAWSKKYSTGKSNNSLLLATP